MNKRRRYMAKRRRKSPIERLRRKYIMMRRKGLVDFKIAPAWWTIPGVPTPAPPGVTLDDLAAEVLAIIDCYENRRFVDITAKLA